MNIGCETLCCRKSWPIAVTWWRCSVPAIPATPLCRECRLHPCLTSHHSDQHAGTKASANRVRDKRGGEASGLMYRLGATADLGGAQGTEFDLVRRAVNKGCEAWAAPEHRSALPEAARRASASPPQFPSAEAVHIKSLEAPGRTRSGRYCEWPTGDPTVLQATASTATSPICRQDRRAHLGRQRCADQASEEFSRPSDARPMPCLQRPARQPAGVTRRRGPAAARPQEREHAHAHDPTVLATSR